MLSRVHPETKRLITAGVQFILFELYVARDELDARVAVVAVELRFVGNIEEFVVQQPFFKVSHAEPDAADRPGRRRRDRL